MYAHGECHMPVIIFNWNTIDGDDFYTSCNTGAYRFRMLYHRKGSVFLLLRGNGLLVFESALQG